MKWGGLQDGILPFYFSSEEPTFVTIFFYHKPLWYNNTEYNNISFKHVKVVDNFVSKISTVYSYYKLWFGCLFLWSYC